jgi:hypothetical protein
MDDYSHCSISKDGCLWTKGPHRPGFPRVLLCTLVLFSYDRPICVYSCQPFQAHGLNCCEVRVEVPIDPTVPWIGAIVGSEVDDAVKKMVHVALTALCEQHLTDTADTPITLFPIHDQEPKWLQCFEVACDLSSPLISIG